MFRCISSVERKVGRRRFRWVMALALLYCFIELRVWIRRAPRQPWRQAANQAHCDTVHPDRLVYSQIRRADDKLLMAYFQEQSTFAFKGTHDFKLRLGDPLEDPYNALDIVSEDELVEIILKAGQNTLTSRHLFYLDFEEHAKERQRDDDDIPLYISQMREPAERFVDQYDRNHRDSLDISDKFFDAMSVDQKFQIDYDNEFINVTNELEYDREMIDRENRAMRAILRNCSQGLLPAGGGASVCGKWNEQTRHFCGYAAVCQEPELSRDALQLAIKHLQTYALVTISELGITASENALHKRIPNWFADPGSIGARSKPRKDLDTGEWTAQDKKRHIGRDHGIRDIRRPPAPGEVTMSALRERNSLDVELYAFARKLYASRLAVCGVSPIFEEKVSVTGYDGEFVIKHKQSTQHINSTANRDYQRPRDRDKDKPTGVWHPWVPDPKDAEEEEEKVNLNAHSTARSTRPL